MSEPGPTPTPPVTVATPTPVTSTSGVSTAATSCPTMLAALMSKPLVALSPIITTTTSSLGLGPAASTTSTVGVALPVTTPSAPTVSSTVMPGTKDSEGFLTPPPASTLLLRRTRVNSTGSSTYVIASTTPVSGAASASSSTNPLFSGIPNPYIPLNPEEANPAGRGSGSAGGRSTTSGRSIKRPKFDDERLVSNVIGRKKDSVLISPSTPDPENSVSLESEPPLTDLAIVLDNSGLGCSQLSTLLHPPPPSPDPLTGDLISPTGKGITLTTTGGGIPGIPKISKGKPASFTTESLAVATMKKQRKETTGKTPADKVKNVDPRTGKRRYIKKKDLRMGGVGEDRPFYALAHPRTFSQSSDFSVTAVDPVLTWRPQDDLTLLVNVKQTCDLKMVHIGATFSCDFKLEHLELRWRALLYDRNVSKVSQAAINNLHSKVRAEIWANALYSKEEDDLIKTVKSDYEKSTVLLKLEELLTENALIFIKWRTVDHLWKHWKELKEFHLLCDQSVKKYFANESFADLEDTMNDAEILTESLDNAVYQEVLVENKHMRKKIRLAEEELIPWKIMAEQAADRPTNGEEISYAMIRGVKVRYLMRSREITLGRWTDTNFVDVDLGLEGPNYKVSRRQAVIQLKGNGEFLFFNQGKHAVFLDGEALLPQHMARLRDQSIIQISGLTFIFLVNEKMVSDLKKRIAENSRGTKFELNGGPPGNSTHRKRGAPPKYSGGPPSYAAHNLMSLTRPRQGIGMGIPFQPRLGRVGVLTRGPVNPSVHPSPYFQRAPGTIGIGIMRPGTNFPIMSNSSPTPTIFRRSSTGPSDSAAGSSGVLQPSFQFGDLTIRPGVPPQPHS